MMKSSFLTFVTLMVATACASETLPETGSSRDGLDLGARCYSPSFTEAQIAKCVDDNNACVDAALQRGVPEQKATLDCLK